MTALLAALALNDGASGMVDTKYKKETLKEKVSENQSLHFCLSFYYRRSGSATGEPILGFQAHETGTSDFREEGTFRLETKGAFSPIRAG